MVKFRASGRHLVELFVGWDFPNCNERFSACAFNFEGGCIP